MRNCCSCVVLYCNTTRGCALSLQFVVVVEVAVIVLLNCVCCCVSGVTNQLLNFAGVKCLVRAKITCWYWFCWFCGSVCSVGLSAVVVV